jgi:methylmalonyl-CoA mutase
VGEHAARHRGVRGRGLRRRRCDQRAPFTWALGRPDAFARRIARNTHLVLQEESGLGRVVDPAAGAWAVEKLTRDLAGKAWELFQDIERKGGMARVLESGFLQGEIAKVAQARAKSIATGRLELTGVSAFPRLGDDGVKVAPHPSGRRGGQGGHLGGGSAGSPSGRTV